MNKRDRKKVRHVEKHEREKVRHWAEFASSLPTDLIEDDNDIVQFGGKSVAAAIGEILTGLGCDVEQPSYAGDQGWYFCGTIKDVSFFCQVTHVEDYIFLFKKRPVVPNWFESRSCAPTARALPSPRR